MATWNTTVSHIADGEAVRASIAGRPDRELERRTDYLLQRLSSASGGASLHSFDAAMSSDVVVGSPVYWNEANARFELALAAAGVDSDTGALQLSPSAIVLGICDAKKSSTSGDVLLLGLGAVDLTAAVGGTVLPGRYYLSALQAGRLVRQEPGISVPVLVAVGGGQVFVQPIPSELLLSHVHYGIELFPKPAGAAADPSEIGNVHVVTDPDSEDTGWLPADDDIFQGLAPTGAKFGYNLSAHPEVERLWPPIPLTNAAIAVERPPSFNPVTTPIIGETVMSPDFVIIDVNGIWWMSNCWNQAPWPVDYNSQSTSSSSLSAEEDSSDDCGPVQRMRIKLYFGKMGFANDKYAVTSLRSLSPELLVENCAGLSATTGDLQLTLDMSLAVDQTGVTGGTVFKTLEDNKFGTGSVLEGLVAGTDNIILESSTKRRLVSGDSSSSWVYQGVTTLSVDLSPADREISPEVIKLGDAKERTHSASGVPYIGLSAGRNSSVRLVFNVSSVGLPADPELSFRLLLLGTASGTFPELTVTSVVISRPTAVATSTAMPADDDPITLDTEVAITADNYLEVESTPVAVSAGDTVYVTISRANDDEYAGEVGIIRANGVVTAG